MGHTKGITAKWHLLPCSEWWRIQAAKFCAYMPATMEAVTPTAAVRIQASHPNLLLGRGPLQTWVIRFFFSSILKWNKQHLLGACSFLLPTKVDYTAKAGIDTWTAAVYRWSEECLPVCLWFPNPLPASLRWDLGRSDLRGGGSPESSCSELKLVLTQEEVREEREMLSA